jgi:NAD(P)-dependent dehydrogenase (short-subunit alcohol dehydrogenase family)
MAGVIVTRGLMQVHYNASKAGVVHMSKSMAMEWVDLLVDGGFCCW